MRERLSSILGDLFGWSTTASTTASTAPLSAALREYFARGRWIDAGKLKPDHTDPADAIRMHLVEGKRIEDHAAHSDGGGGEPVKINGYIATLHNKDDVTVRTIEELTAEEIVQILDEVLGKWSLENYNNLNVAAGKSNKKPLDYNIAIRAHVSALYHAEPPKFGSVPTREVFKERMVQFLKAVIPERDPVDINVANQTPSDSKSWRNTYTYYVESLSNLIIMIINNRIKILTIIIFTPM
ncbi:unnamed protein product [Amoebophrya sp. A120]|nr:unnamed protein product [Amoebophrya sp. A120]|eukprot:GSA120T00024475001.1